MSELAPGMTVTPTIRLVRALGAGGMGSVWVADHLALRTQVVVKFMSAELAASPEAVARFSREAAAAAQVKSPHVVQMLDHGVTPDGVPFIVMELLEGHDLGHHLEKKGGRLSLEETAQIIAQTAKALARAHERGIVHRDIKPDNIFLTDVGSGELFVKLLDFGIAKGTDGGGALSGSGTKTGATIGTPYYMSPEQIVGAKTIDLRSDLWSLGVVAYQCVVGGVPFNADTFGALAVMINGGPLPQPSIALPGTSPHFDAWFARACAREPRARFGSAKELADTLSAVARGEPFGAAAMSGSGPRNSAVPTPPPGLAPAGGYGSPAGYTSPMAQSAPGAGRASTTGGVGFATAPGQAPARSGAPWGLVIGLLFVVLLVGGGAVLAVMLLRRGGDAGGAAAASASPTATTSASSPPATAPPTAAAPPATLASAASDAPPSPAASASASGATQAPPPPRPAGPTTTSHGTAAPPATPAAPPAPTPAPTPTTKNEKDIF